MKLITFVCALALAGAVGGCGEDEENGTGGTAATGGTGGAGGGTGGTGGTAVVTDACTNAADTAVYEGLPPYTNDDGTFTGTEAAGEIAADCVFGTAPNLTGTGCGAEVGVALGNPSTENIAALTACVVACTVEQPVDLSANCLSCYGGSVTCGAVNCAGPCAGGTDLPECEACRCGDNAASEDCVTNFETCAGIASTVVCP